MHLPRGAAAVGNAGRSRTGRGVAAVEGIGESCSFGVAKFCAFICFLLAAELLPTAIVTERFLHVLRVLQKVDMSSPPDHRGSPFAQDVVLMRVKLFHLSTQGRTFVLFARIRAVRFATVHLHVLVLHCAHLLEHLVDLTTSGDSTIIQNLVENWQQAVANSTQHLLKVPGNGSGPGFRVNQHDTILLGLLRRHQPVGTWFVSLRYRESSTQKVYMTMTGELNCGKQHIYMSVVVMNY